MVFAESGHALAIRAVAWSPDGKTVASGAGWWDADKGSVLLWEVAAGQLRRKRQADVGTIKSLDFSPDSTLLAAGPKSFGPIRVWDTATGDVLASWNAADNSVHVTWSPCGEYLLGTGYHRANVWNFRTQERLRSFESNHPRFCGGWFPDGSRFFAANEIGRVGFAGVDTAVSWTNVQLRDMQEPFCLDLSPAGDTFVAGTENGELRLFSAKTGSPVLSLSDSQPGITSALSWSPDGQRLASGTRDGWVQTWDATSGMLLGKVARHGTSQLREQGVNVVAWHPDGRTLAITTHNPNVLIAKAGAGETKETTIKTKMNGQNPWLVVAWSPEGDRLAWSSGAIGVCELGGEPIFERATSNRPELLAWSPNGKLLAEAGGHMGDVCVWDPLSGDVHCKLKATKSAWKPVRSLAWSPDGTRIAVGCSSRGGNQIQLWQTESGKLLESLLGHQDSVNALHWLDDNCLMSVGDDRTLREWNTNTGRLISTRPAPAGGKLFSPDGSRVAYQSRNVIRVWSTDTCRIERTFALVCDDQYISITGDGQIEHSPDLRTELVYVLLTEEGQQLTMTPPLCAESTEGGGE